MKNEIAKKWDNGELERIPPEKATKHLQAAVDVNAESLNPNENDSDDIAFYRARLATYITYCLNTQTQASNLGACAALGIQLSTYKSWLKGKSGAEKKEFAEQIRNIFSMYREQLALAGLITAPVAIFWAKNFDGLKDEPEDDEPAPDLLGEEIDPSTIKEKYKNIIIDD